MPDVVPNELNLEMELDMGSAGLTQEAVQITKIDFPLLVEGNANKRVVNVITDVIYDFPYNLNENEQIAAEFHGITADGHIQRAWSVGLFRKEPTEAQTGYNGLTTALSIGNPDVIDSHQFAENILVDGTAAAGLAAMTFGGTNTVRENLQFLGIGTIVPDSYVWLAMGRLRHVSGTGSVNWTGSQVIKAGVRIKYIQTTLPLAEWVGLYFSAQQLGTAIA